MVHGYAFLRTLFTIFENQEMYNIKYYKRDADNNNRNETQMTVIKHVNSIFTVFSKIVKIVSSCICAKMLHHIPTKMVCFLFLILCSENIVKPPADPTMSQSHFSAQLYASSVVGRIVWAASGTAFNEAG